MNNQNELMQQLIEIIIILMEKVIIITYHKFKDKF